MTHPPIPLELHLALRRRQQRKQYDYSRLTTEHLIRMREIGERARVMGLDTLPLQDVLDMIVLYEIAEGKWPDGCDPWRLTPDQREDYSHNLDRVALGVASNPYEQERIREIEAILRQPPRGQHDDPATDTLRVGSRPA